MTEHTNGTVSPGPEGTPLTLATTRAVETVKIIAGKPSDAVDRSRLASWSFSGLVPRTNFTTYRAREGRTVLETLRLVRDRDPDAAQAISNFLLLIGQGYRSEARTGDGVDQRAQEYLTALDTRVGEEYGGGMDMLVDVLNLTLVTQGAMALEIEVSDDLEEVADFHPVNPQRIVFKREKASGRLMRGIVAPRDTPGADAEGFLELSPRQFRYMPLHPDVEEPYGRSPILAALTAVFFKVQVLDDLRAVVHNQGYPRIKASILEQVITNNLPKGTTPDQIRTLVTELQTAVQASLGALNPDDAIVVTSSVDVGYLSIPSGTLVDVKALSEVLDKQIISGLKQLPILLGRNEGATTTHASVQWKIFVLLIEALRRRTKRLIEWAHTTALQVAGFQSTAHVTFDDLQTNDRLIDAQALETETRTWAALVDRGWASDEEASNALLHHEPAGTPAPAPEPARRARQGRRHLPRTRVADPFVDERATLEDELRMRVAAQFTQLAADYPTDAVVEQVTGLTDIDPVAVEAIVRAWFEENPGQQWSQELTDILSEHYQVTFNVIGQLALGELGITVTFDLKNPAMIQQLQDLGAERVTGMNSETRRQLVNQLVEGASAGEGVEQLGRRIRSQVENMTVRRSELIAVTETATATGIASLETYTRNGVEQKSWLTAGDDRVTEGCQANQDAGAIAIDAAFPSGHDAPPRFPSCRCALLPELDGYAAPKTPWTGG